ncbi:MAG: NUDIX domain-containing protein [Patescibacteria group bacterium]
MSIEITKVGMGVVILKEGKILLGKRKGSFGSEEYASPGGHLEYMESFENGIRREVREECGIEIKNIKFIHVANEVTYAPKHYVNVQFLADWESGEPITFESEKIGGWNWYSFDSLPDKIFELTRKGIESYKTGRNYFDIEK